MKRCMYCGNENDDTSMTCSKCGNRLLDIFTEDTAGENRMNDVPDLGPAEYNPQVNTASEDFLQGNAAEEDDAQEPYKPELYFGDNPSSQGEQTPGEVPSSLEEPVSSDAAPEQGQPYPETPQENAGGEEIPDFLKQNGVRPEAQDFYRQTGEQPAGDYQSGQPQYAVRPEVQRETGYPEGQPYAYAQNYAGQPQVQQQYGGQAYGYQNQAPYGNPMPGQENVNYGRPQQTVGGQLLVKARKRVKSFLFFLVVFLYTVKTVAAILNVITGNNMVNLNEAQERIQKALQSNLAIRFMNGAVDMVQGADKLTILGVGLGLCVPGVLICLGLWMMFLKTRRTTEEISTSGYTLTRVMVLLKFIAICLLLAAGLILSVAFVVAAGAASSVTSIIVGIVMLIIMILISALTILFYVQLLHALKVIKWNAKTGADVGKISTFVPVVAILLAILTGLGMLPMAPNDYLGLIEQGAVAAWLLFSGIWVLVYRGTVKR